MRQMVCRVSRTTLIARVLDTGSPPSVLEGHVATCLRCQATVAHSLRLRRTLARLSPRPVPVASGVTPTPWMAAGLASALAAVLWLRLRHHEG